jgi:hypothetical protein
VQPVSLGSRRPGAGMTGCGVVWLVRLRLHRFQFQILGLP